MSSNLLHESKRFGGSGVSKQLFMHVTVVNKTFDKKIRKLTPAMSV